MGVIYAVKGINTKHAFYDINTQYAFSGIPDVHAVVLPRAAVLLLQHILREMAQDHVVTLIPVQAELTTQQAANRLNVSRPYLVSLLESGVIPYRNIGTRRRVLFEHLMAYKKADDAKRMEALNGLTRQAQELGLGY
jgi:excisionase family DNA binding protein